MKITEAITIIKNTEMYSNKKSIIKSYKEFLTILKELQAKELSETQNTLVENTLDNLLKEVDFKKSPRKIQHKLQLFKNFLKEKLSLTVEGHYTSLGIALGLCFGIVFGAFIERYIGASIGMTIGMLFGIAIGKSLDAKAEIEGRVLKVKS